MEAFTDLDASANRRKRHNETMKRYFANHPEQALKKSERVKARYHSDPEYAERVRARARLYAAQKSAVKHVFCVTVGGD